MLCVPWGEAIQKWEHGNTWEMAVTCQEGQLGGIEQSRPIPSTEYLVARTMRVFKGTFYQVPSANWQQTPSARHQAPRLWY